MEFNLTEKLYEIKKKGKYPMHMPGHKRSEKMSEFGNELGLPYEFDITEIEPYDNLHAPEGILKEMGEHAAALYGAKFAYPLVNGSTAGILSAIGATTRKNKRVIVSRASHKSVYNAIELFSLSPTYIYPAICPELGIFGSVTVQNVEEAFADCPDAAAVIITSPTYEGVISDIKAIADVVHSHGARLIVDCAHGAHLGFFVNDYLPDSGIKYADIAIVSLHKTMPALTQTALCLSFSDDSELDADIRRMLSNFMTSSPSYILLSSIDKCLDIIEKHAERLFGEYIDALAQMKEKLSSLQNIFVLGYANSPDVSDIFALDRGKLNVFCGGLVDIAGNEVTADILAKFLRLNGFEIEMVSTNYLILMTSIMDDFDKLFRLCDLLLHFDMWCCKADKRAEKMVYIAPTVVMSASAASLCDGERLDFSECRDRVSLDYVMCYPPGIPIVCPGEVITQEIIEFIEAQREANVNVLGTDKIKVKKQ